MNGSDGVYFETPAKTAPARPPVRQPHADSDGWLDELDRKLADLGVDLDEDDDDDDDNLDHTDGVTAHPFPSSATDTFDDIGFGDVDDSDGPAPSGGGVALERREGTSPPRRSTSSHSQPGGVTEAGGWAVTASSDGFGLLGSPDASHLPQGPDRFSSAPTSAGADRHSSLGELADDWFEDDVEADLPAPTAPPGATRDGRGAWAVDGRRARGVRDVTLGDLWDFDRDELGRVLVPEAIATCEPELEWCLRWLDDEDPAAVSVGDRWVSACAVPAMVWEAHAKVRVDGTGPQFDVRRVVDISTIADLAGLPVATVRVYRSRGLLPDPVATVAGSPVWTRSQVHWWLIARQRR